jgi:hypothetical protein
MYYMINYKQSGNVLRNSVFQPSTHELEEVKILALKRDFLDRQNSIYSFTVKKCTSENQIEDTTCELTNEFSTSCYDALKFMHKINHPGHHFEMLEKIIVNLPDDNLQKSAQSIYDNAKDLIENGQEEHSVINQVKLTNELLLSRTPRLREKINQYRQNAKNVHGKPSLCYKIIGAAMTVLGVAEATLGVTIIARVTNLDIAVGVGLLVGSVASIAIGTGFFVHGCQRSLCKSMGNLSIALLKT